MIKIIEPCTEYSRILEYTFVVEINWHQCSWLVRSVSSNWDIESDNSIIWDTYVPSFPRLDEYQEQQLINRLLNPKYIIVDWAGNRMFPNEEFDSFEDWWAYIDEHIPLKDENDRSHEDVFVQFL